jgi:hypothetical protein
LPGISVHPTQHVLREELISAQAMARFTHVSKPEPQPDVQSLIRAELAAFADNVLAPGIGKAVAGIVEERVAALKIEISRLQTALEQFKYLGIWEEGRQYRAGNFVTFGGAIHHCNADTNSSKPGNGSSCWTLAAARGRDGKDAVAPAPAAPRTATMTRGGPR